MTLEMLHDAIIEDSGTADCGHSVECTEICSDCNRCQACCHCQIAQNASQSEYIEIFIPSLPPGINRTYVHKVGGGVALTPSARQWDADAALIVGATGGRFGFEPDLTASYQIIIRWWGGHHDADAHLKLVQDCITRKLGFDDRQIQACTIQRCNGPINDEPQGVLVYLFKFLERDWVSSLILEARSTMDWQKWSL